MLCNKRTDARGGVSSSIVQRHTCSLLSLCRQHHRAEGKPLLSFSGDKSMNLCAVLEDRGLWPKSKPY